MKRFTRPGPSGYAVTMTDAILCSVADGVARITLNRPEQLNAFGAEMAGEWERVTGEVVARGDVRAILLAANGRAFCAGGNVREMAEGGFDEAVMERLAHQINRGQLSLIESAIPVVVAANGATAGGGLGVLLSGDYAIAGENSRIGCIYAKVGLTPDLTVSALLARAVGERRALQLVLQDLMLSAEEARDWGLIAEVVPDDRVLARAEEVARFIADNAADARGQAKRLVREGYGRGLRAQLDEEARTIARALTTSDAKALIGAFTRA